MRGSRDLVIVLAVGMLAIAAVLTPTLIRPASKPSSPRLDAAATQLLAVHNLKLSAPSDAGEPAIVESAVRIGLPKALAAPFRTWRPAPAAVSRVDALRRSGTTASSAQLAYVSGPFLKTVPGRGCKSAAGACELTGFDRRLCWVVVSSAGAAAKVTLVDATTGRVLARMVTASAPGT